ncbi:MAG: DUF4259 domain-containing protein [Planctomycetes bacterium]|nr:DUF4259 domain-containing protein [Planctomycetota bacterium]
MGRWGIGPFDNDHAADWLYELAEADDAEVLRDALGSALGAAIPDEIDSALALAAAETVAAWCGRPAPELPEEVTEWVLTRARAPREIVDLAWRAVDRVGRSSVMREVWLAEDDASAWVDYVTGLAERLRDR